jgi:hypothetical protein
MRLPEFRPGTNIRLRRRNGQTLITLDRDGSFFRRTKSFSLAMLSRSELITLMPMGT